MKSIEFASLGGSISSELLREFCDLVVLSVDFNPNFAAVSVSTHGLTCCPLLQNPPVARPSLREICNLVVFS